ncbi:hypothetical protein OG874_20735 [Nocardia sp. NBC_00565]|nr:hypothetical protein [Nocardia sp. NBC_00565]WUC07363.1 hypothetical protein OG874_20735 [Nocardia sp. NBC_00565]
MLASATSTEPAFPHPKSRAAQDVRVSAQHAGVVAVDTADRVVPYRRA